MELRHGKHNELRISLPAEPPSTALLHPRVKYTGSPPYGCDYYTGRSEKMPSLEDLPVELLLDHLLPVLPVRDLLALGATNHLFASICYDETFWKTKCKADFNFSGSRTARTKGWRFIYKGLSHPKVFVWGFVVRRFLRHARSLL